MVGVCDGGQDRGRSEGSVTTTEAQEGRTRRGEVRTVQERESRELELKLELPGRCQGREPGPVLATWAGPGNRGAGPGPRRGIALLQCPPQVRQVWSAVTPTNAATVNQGRAGGSGGGLGGVWVLGGGGELAGWAVRVVAEDSMASLGIRSACVRSRASPACPAASFAFPDHLFRFQDAVLFQEKQAKDPTTAARPPHDGPYLSGQSFVTTPEEGRVVGTGSHLATTMAVEASVPCGNCPVEAIIFARDDDILVPQTLPSIEATDDRIPALYQMK